jgi:hypothetical protein
MIKKDWVSDEELKFVDLCHKWINALQTPDIRGSYGWEIIFCGFIMADIEPFLEAFAAFSDEDSEENRREKDDTMLKAKKSIRNVATSITWVRNNKDMTDDDRAELGIPPADQELPEWAFGKPE